MWLNGTEEIDNRLFVLKESCNITDAKFPVTFFRPGEYALAQEEIHRVFGFTILAMLAVWFGHHQHLLAKSLTFLWAGRAQMFIGGFLFLWLFFLMSPRNALGPMLISYVLKDWQQLQHLCLALNLFAAGSADAAIGRILQAELGARDKEEARARTLWRVMALHAMWLANTLCVGFIFLFHPQDHAIMAAKHQMLGHGMILGALLTVVSKVVETLTNPRDEMLRYPCLMFVPTVCWVQVMFLLIFFPHHKEVVHKGYFVRCQPDWLVTFVLGSGVGASITIVAVAALRRGLCFCSHPQRIQSERVESVALMPMGIVDA